MRILRFLVQVSIHLRNSARRRYVEVVMHGQTEGKFLDDPKVRHEETMGQISKLGVFCRCMAKRGTDHYHSQISDFQSTGPAQT